MASNEVARGCSDELSSEQSNGPNVKPYAKRLQKTRRKRARMMQDSESDGDSSVHFVHDCRSRPEASRNTSWVSLFWLLVLHLQFTGLHL